MLVHELLKMLKYLKTNALLLPSPALRFRLALECGLSLEWIHGGEKKEMLKWKYIKDDLTS